MSETEAIKSIEAAFTVRREPIPSKATVEIQELQNKIQRIEPI